MRPTLLSAQDRRRRRIPGMGTGGEPRPRRLRSRLGPLVVSAGLVVALAACSPNANDTKTATAGLPDILQNLTANHWALDRAASTPAIHTSVRVTLTFTPSHHLSGIGPCGSYRGSFTLDGSTITIGPVRKSNVFCTASAEVAQDLYLRVLTSMRTVEPTPRDHLHLSGGSGSAAQLHFQGDVAKEP